MQNTKSFGPTFAFFGSLLVLDRSERVQTIVRDSGWQVILKEQLCEGHKHLVNIVPCLGTDLHEGHIVFVSQRYPFWLLHFPVDCEIELVAYENTHYILRRILVDL